MEQNIIVYRPHSLEGALLALEREPSALPVAGATELIPSMRSGKKRPGALVALDGVGLDSISRGREGLELGAAASLSQVIDHGELACPPFSLLRQALLQTGSWQIRNVATLGGALASGIPGLDAAAALLALDARVRLASAGSARELPLSAFYIAPMRTRMRPGELLTSVLLPPPDPGEWRVWFRKVGLRKAYTMPIVNMASALCLREGVIASWRLAAGGVGGTSLLLEGTTAQAAGKRPEEVDWEALERRLQEEISPADSLQASGAYKRLLCGNLLQQIREELFTPPCPGPGGNCCEEG